MIRICVTIWSFGVLLSLLPVSIGLAQELPITEIQLELTYPVGLSPKVFTEGWLFGARAIANPGQSDQIDISNQVTWGGTGKFTPAEGQKSHPVFDREGVNTIELKVAFKGETIRRSFTVDAINPYYPGGKVRRYAVLGDIAKCAADGHGAPGDPLPVQGPIITGSPTVTLGGFPVARQGDKGVHAACSGPNTFVVASGDLNVLIDGFPAARIGDKTRHCGGMGTIQGPMASSSSASSSLGDKEKQKYYELKTELKQLLESLISTNDRVLTLKSELEKLILAQQEKGEKLLEEINESLADLNARNSEPGRKTRLTELFDVFKQVQEYVRVLKKHSQEAQDASSQLCDHEESQSESENLAETQAAIAKFELEEVEKLEAQAQMIMGEIDALSPKFESITLSLARECSEKDSVDEDFDRAFVNFKRTQGQHELYQSGALYLEVAFKELDRLASKAQWAIERGAAIWGEINALNKDLLQESEKEGLKAAEGFYREIRSLYPIARKNIREANQLRNTTSTMDNDVTEAEKQLEKAAERSLKGIASVPYYNCSGLGSETGHEITKAKIEFNNLKQISKRAADCFARSMAARAGAKDKSSEDLNPLSQEALAALEACNIQTALDLIDRLRHISRSDAAVNVNRLEHAAQEKTAQMKLHARNLEALARAVQVGDFDSIKSELKKSIKSVTCPADKDRLREIGQRIKEFLKREVEQNQNAMRNAIDRGQATQQRDSLTRRQIADSIISIMTQINRASSGSETRGDFPETETRTKSSGGANDSCLVDGEYGRMQPEAGRVYYVQSSPLSRSGAAVTLYKIIPWTKGTPFPMSSLSGPHSSLAQAKGFVDRICPESQRSTGSIQFK